jgi:hypothetical protein
MRTTVALVGALAVWAVGAGEAPAQTGKLSLVNERVTYGILGTTRADAKLLPGDWFCLAFDIEGLSADPNGRMNYRQGMSVVDAGGKIWYQEEPKPLEAINSLGGNQIPAFAHVVVGLDQPPGEFTVKITVTDIANKSTASLSHKFEIQPATFGLVRLQLSSDFNNTQHVPSHGFVGQSIVVNFLLVNFDRDKATQQPNVKVEMIVTDQTGKATATNPVGFELNRDIPAAVRAVPAQFLLNLNRAGSFTVKLKATDQVTKKSSELSFPLVAEEVK